ncbi:MAG TPA: PilW family protein [Polyangia bacterium]|nr:PilW family protein [Polyangia bacterium]
MRSRGFTLMELLISLALAGVVVAGALQLHVAFNGHSSRQQQIADMQQSLRVSMQILERAIRSAGSGMVLPKGTSPPTPPPSYTAGVMLCGTAKLYAFEWWNTNSPFPATHNPSPITNDADPDYFKVIAAQPDSATITAYTAGTATVAGPLAGWAIGDLVLVLSGNFPTVPPNGIPTSCLRTITAVSGQQLTFGSPGAPLACNLLPGATPTDCMSALPSVAGGPNDVEIKHFVNETIYRVIPAATPSDTPKLALRQAPIGNINPGIGWMPIADNIEDMQIAMVMSDGGICNSVDDPASVAQNCDPSQALAVRITLVARSTNTIAGNPPAPKGGFEDEPMSTPNDGYLRRSMTTEIMLRN